MELCRRLRVEPTTSSTPIVVITAKTFEIDLNAKSGTRSERLHRETAFSSRRGRSRSVAAKSKQFRKLTLCNDVTKSAEKSVTLYWYKALRKLQCFFAAFKEVRTRGCQANCKRNTLPATSAYQSAPVLKPGAFFCEGRSKILKLLKS